MKIIPLSKNNVDEAVNLVTKIFDSKEEDMDFPGKWMPVSLSPNSKKSREICATVNCTYLKDWVGIDEVSKKVIGTTGIYTLKDDEKEVAWLGWYCLDSRFRGKGFGSQLLEFTLNEMRKMKKKYARLYTIDDEISHEAIKIYKRKGFKKIRMKKEGYDKGTIFMELKL